ncbi:hypothetical protein AB0K24_47540, partial [Streptomyces mirabilis]|uniref:hypothetical protein n=1 Tax=Streptomyces mirabilis TaxID=68239 RepID=UPI00344210B4
SRLQRDRLREACENAQDMAREFGIDVLIPIGPAPPALPPPGRLPQPRRPFLHSAPTVPAPVRRPLLLLRASRSRRRARIPCRRASANSAGRSTYAVRWGTRYGEEGKAPWRRRDRPAAMLTVYRAGARRPDSCGDWQLVGVRVSLTVAGAALTLTVGSLVDR